MQKIFSWCGTVVVGSLLVCVLCLSQIILALSWPINRTFYIKVVNWTALALLSTLRLLGTKISFDPGSHRPGHYIIVSNHQSVFDIPFILWHLRSNSPRFIAKRELGRFIPAVSHSLRHMGSALIDRSDPRSAMPAIKAFGETCLKNSWSPAIFPEGTRTKDGKLRKFKTAGLVVLLRSMPDVPVLPLCIQGFYHLVENKMCPMPLGVRVKVKALDVIPRAAGDEETLPSLIEDLLRAEIERGCSWERSEAQNLASLDSRA